MTDPYTLGGQGSKVPASVRMMSIDYVTDVMSVELVDGQVVLERFGEELHRSQNIVRMSFAPKEWEVSMHLVGGQVIRADVGGRLKDPPSPVVYLDQNHWITLARALYSPGKLSAPLRTASNRLMELADQRRITLPLSGAHLAETARTDGKWRRELAPTMIAFSRGWQMMSAISVRRLELGEMFRSWRTKAPAASVRNQVFTLEPERVFSDRHGQPLSVRPPSSASPIAELSERLSWIAAMYDTLLADERDDQAEGRRIAGAWAKSQHELALRIRQEPKAKRGAAELSLLYVIRDLDRVVPEEASAAGITAEEFSAWLAADAMSTFAKMPMLGLYQAAHHHRILNADDRWEENDLLDMLFLSCAAAYADVVVAEGKATGYLTRAAKRLGRSLAVARSLDVAMPLIEARIADQSKASSG